MKTRKILAIAIIAIMFLALFIGTAHAWATNTAQVLISTKTYSANQEITSAEESASVNIGATLQLKAYSVMHSEVGEGGTVTKTDTIQSEITNNATWASETASIATVSSTGLVTGLKSGTARITASYDIDGLTKTTTIYVKVNKAEFYDFSGANFEIVKEETGIFYDARIYVTGIDTASVKAYKEANESCDFYLLLSDKSATIPETYEEASAIMSGKNKDLNYPVVMSTDLLDNNKLRLSNNADEFYARAEDSLYMTILESYYDAESGKTKMHASKANTKVAKPAQEAYGNKIKFDIFDNWTYMAVNEPSSGNQKKMEMKVAKVNDISKYTNENKYTNLMADLKSTTNFVYDNQITFDRNGAGGTNAGNEEITTTKIQFEKGAYYLLYAKLLGENGKYKEVEDIELYYYTGSMLKPVSEFNNNESQSGNYVTTNPTTTTGDNSIATKKIPQTGATPVFMIVLGSAILVAGVFVVANKKYRDIK